MYSERTEDSLRKCTYINWKQGRKTHRAIIIFDSWVFLTFHLRFYKTFLSKVMIRFITVPFRPGTITYSMNNNGINGAIQSTPVISCIFLFFPAGQNLSNCFRAIWSKRKSLVISAKFKTWWNLLLHWNLLFQVSNVNFLWIFYSSFIFLRISS